MDKLKIQIDANIAGKLAKTFPSILSGESLELDLQAIENLAKLVKVGNEMREKQAIFDRTRSDTALANRKRLEAAFDSLLESLAPIIEPPSIDEQTLF